MKKVLLIASVMTLAAFGQAHAAGDATAGQQKSMACAGCHGADGNSAAANFPKLAGQHAAYTAKQLREFKSGARKDATMAGMVAALNDQDIENLAAYYEGQTVKLGKAASDKVELGEKIYRSGNAATGVSACAACHAPNGVGNPQALFPSVGGQHADYTIAQLKKFRKGERLNDAGSMMRVVARKMSDDEIEAVAQYIQGLR